MKASVWKPVHGALLVAAILLGWRTLGSTRLVVSSSMPSEVSDGVEALQTTEAQERDAVERIRFADSLLAAIHRAGVPSDPFHPRIASRPPSVAQELPKRETIVPTPTIVLMAVDSARPQVVLRVGDAVSGLLSEGETWGGWTVTSIHPDGVEVASGERKERLGIPRGK